MSSFKIIPVLDLKHGKVVRARAGDRATYQPIVTPLASTSDAMDVLRGLRTLGAFPIVYIADLGAIMGETSHAEVLSRLTSEVPEVEFWVDGGFRSGSEVRAAIPQGMTPVLGSESLADAEALVIARGMLGTDKVVLSLDYRGGQFMGPAEIELQSALWPDRIILMTLDRVGTGTGPDLEALSALIRRAGGRAVFAAGGVRNADDLAQLQAIGVAGVLVATALHDGRLSAAALSRFHH